MAKRKYKASAIRQKGRTLQRGSMQRSTLVALVVVATLGLIASQAHKFGTMHQSLSQNFVTWTGAKGFAVQNVDISGRKKVSAQAIVQALQIQRGMPIFAYDPKAAQERLSENPWFKAVNVERRLPDTVFIRVEERIPAARWQVDGKLALIDSEGVALNTDQLDQYKYLPIIIGQNARNKMVNLITLLTAQPEIAKEVMAATWIGNRRWDLKLKNNMVIRLPAREPELALARLAGLQEKDNVLGRDLVSIDLRLPNQAILQPTIRANALIERPNFSDAPQAGKTNI